MLPTPSTPTSLDVADVVDANSGGATVSIGGWGYPSPPSSTSPLSSADQMQVQAGHSFALATPPASSSPGVGEAPDLDIDLEPSHLTDEDQDMSEGGAPLSDLLLMSPEHAQALNAEMDILDAEVMGQANMDELLLSGNYQPSTIATEPSFYLPTSTQTPATPPHLLLPSDELDEDMLYDQFEAAEAASLPTTMMEVSQQLEHLQDAHENMDFIGVADAQHDNGIGYGTSPPLISPPFFSGVETSGEPSQEEVFLPTEPYLNSLEVSSDPGLPYYGWHGGFTVSTVPADWAPGEITVSLLNDLEVFWDDDTSEADRSEVGDLFNLSLTDFLYTWGRTSAREDRSTKRTLRGPAISAIRRQTSIKNLEPVVRSDLQGDRCDIQRINWKELQVSRLDAKRMRKHTYKNYTNLYISAQWHSRLKAFGIANCENYFKFRQMNFNHRAHLSHFQLRNLVACASRDHIFYAGKSRVMHYSPTSRSNPRGLASTAMDLRNHMSQPYHHAASNPVQISTMTIGHDILVAGGFCGEYGIVNLRASRNTRHAEGLLTYHDNNITNHVQVHLSRGSSLPIAAFSSNDNGVRLLDVNTNKFIAEHKYAHAINCTAISPDQRLRVLVGDAQNVMICNAETGEVLQDLKGHLDFGFACDWADDGWTVATGNQDMQIKIWDARKWTNIRGDPYPLATIAADMAGVRKLKFSPGGSGRRVLVAAEPADFVSIIDAETFNTKQTLNFFGEISGVDFTNDGQDLIIANSDGMRGGIMEFERCDFASAVQLWDDERPEFRGDYSHYEDESYDRRGRSHRAVPQTVVQQREPAMLGTTMAPF